LSRPTITRYLDLLTEASVIALLPGIDGQGAQAKVYFLDNGILSMLLADDRLLEVRKPEDQAMLLENFVVSELIKRYSYAGVKLTELGYLWHPKGKIDIVAFRNGAIQHAWEVKLTDSQGGSRVTREALGDAELEVVNLGNISRFFG
jgi:predicted AAA+ superfamily ATPase